MSSLKIENFIKSSVLELSAYKVNGVESGEALKLDANESNYTLGKNIKKRYANFIKDTLINLYPDSGSKNLIGLLEKFYGIAAKNFIFGNGSDELISIIMLSMKKDVVVNIPSPSFSMYDIIARYNDLKTDIVKLDETFFDLPENIIVGKDKNSKRIFFFSYPNNPTGNHFNGNIIKNLLEDKNNIVVIDEAYIFFSNEESFIKYIYKYDNLIVLRTFSKIGLAGLRFGMLFSGDKLINEFKKIKLPFNINSLTLISIEFFLNNFGEFDKNIKKTIKQREKLYSVLNKFDFIDVYPSDANFLLIRLNDKKLKNKFDKFLKDNNIIIRSFTGGMELFYRITVGTPTDNKNLAGYFKNFEKGFI
ncbi:MAG: pyridoxal phosphate-dependent aminotransferase [bacterium]